MQDDDTVLLTSSHANRGILIIKNSKKNI